MGRQGFFKEHPLLTHTIWALLASLAIVVIVFIVLRHYGRVGQEYPTPYVVGSYIDELGNDELELSYVVVDSVYQPNQRGGYILRQDPDSGSMIKRGRKIYLTIASYNPDNAVVPDLRSLSVRNAISQLENEGLHGGRLIFVDDPHHVVLDQRYKGRTVASGRRLEKGAQVDLVVGNAGNEKLTIIPYVVGSAPSKARRDILSSSLNVGAEHYDRITDMSRAIVYKQSPSYTGRNTATFGSSVELWYCDISVVAMEELERMKQKQIEDSIRAAMEAESGIGDDGGIDFFDLNDF